jgi:hypothetical protein
MIDLGQYSLFNDKLYNLNEKNRSTITNHFYK